MKFCEICGGANASTFEGHDVCGKASCLFVFWQIVAAKLRA